MSETKLRPSETEGSVSERYLAVVNELVERNLGSAAAQLNAEFDAVIKERVRGIGKVAEVALGVTAKATVMITPSALRKAMLEQTENKRSPEATGNATPDGNAPLDPYKKLLKPFSEVSKK